MRTNLLMFLAVSLIVTSAAATELDAATVIGDCNGWSATVTVEWRDGDFEANLDYVVSLVDGDGNVLESFTWSGPVTRELGDPRFVDYTFGEEWTVYAPGGEYTVHHEWYLTPNSGINTSIIDDAIFVCDTVATEGVRWGSLKALFD